ncbi:MAG TPA: division/cell wall cluster transcriptional repressor MraZ [Candidatus Omnitrophota bacterium]|nr:division/cell wall cluster transcriptional repressor MraZ [Candidatus Omnitrophota bacterium]HPS20030.1 division/cell wall cluster transcriptional repressor MraZ [Candidatus Omnitrophota bacterium]
MFYGEYLHAIDAKGRVIIPAGFRSVMSDKDIKKLFVTRGLDECLFVFGENEWRAQEEKFKSMTFMKKDVRKFKRLFFSGASETAPDGQWRILIPDYLREYAGLKRDIKIIGVSDRIEIWDRTKWDEFYKFSKENYEDIAEQLIVE